MFVRNSLFYSAAHILSQGVLFVQGFVVRRLLPPEVMGLWNFAGVVRSLASQATLGLLTGAGRELPLLRGKLDKTALESCRSTVLTYTVIEVAVVAVVVIGYAMLVHGRDADGQYIAVILTAGLLFLTRLQEAVITFFQGDQQYVTLSKTLAINSVIFAALVVLGTIVWGLWGLFAGALSAEFLRTAWLYRAGQRSGLDSSFSWNRSVFRRLTALSLSQRIAELPLGLFLMADTLWVSKLLGLAPLAIYAMARTFLSQITEVMVRFSTVLSTRVLEQHGRQESRNKIAKDLERFLHFQLLVAAPLIVWATLSVVPPLIRQVTPAYTDGIEPMGILLLACFFDTKINNLGIVWVAQERFRAYGLSNWTGFFILLSSLTIAWFVLGIQTLVAVAYCVVLANFAMFAYVMSTAGKETLGARNSLTLFVRTIVSAAWLLVVVHMVFEREHAVADFGQNLLRSALDSATALALILPLVSVNLVTTGVGRFLYNRLFTGAHTRRKASRNDL